MPRLIRRLIPLFLATALWPFAAAGQGFPPTPVIVAAVIERPLPAELSLVGTVQPRRSATVGAEVEGKVVARQAEGGLRVKRGAALYRLQNDVLEAALQEAEADLDLRRYELAQDEDLYAKEAVSEQQYRTSRYELARAQSKHAGLKRQLEDLTIRAPFAADIIQPLVEVGEWVSRGTPVARLVSLDTFRVYVNVPEKHISRLRRGDTAQMVIEALGVEPIQGRIVAVLAEGYPDARSFPVVIEAPNPGGVRSNMSALARFTVGTEAKQLLVHKDAVVTSAFGQSVFLAQDDKAVSRPLKTGLAYQEYIAVEGDIAPGDLTIVRGNERLRDGQDIRVLRKHQ